MNHHWLTRLLSSVIALQLLCAPVTMVQAAQALQEDESATLEPISPEPVEQVPTQPEMVDPPQEDAVPEVTPPLPPKDPSAELLGYTGFWYTAWSMGLPTETGEEGLLGFDRYFRPEIDTATTTDVASWLYATKNDDLEFLIDHTELTMKPSPARVPDLKPEGFYAYTDQAIAGGIEEDVFYDDSYLRTWQYAPGMEKLFGPEGTEKLPLKVAYSGVEAIKTGYVLPLVARWLPSSTAQMTALTLLETTDENNKKSTPLLYPKSLAGSATPAKGSVSFDPAVTEYYLRVPATTQTLNLAFEAFEPYYEYHKALMAGGSGIPQSPVAVTYTFGGKTAAVPLNTAMTPLPTIAPPRATVPNNTQKTPARSTWAIAAPIPLEKSAGNGRLYNDVVVSITAPDGVTQTDYTFHIQRMTDPTLTRNPGNTPFGMIARDTHPSAWGTTPEEIAAGKADAFRHFTRTHRFYQSDASTHYPKGAENQSGSIFGGLYTADAWLNAGNISTENYDESPTAIVAYQDSAFCDPGFTITDSEGNQGSFGTKNDSRAEVDSVHRSLKLRTAIGALTPDQVKQSGGTEQYYLSGNLQTDPATELVCEGDGSDQIDLRGERVLPGIYTLEYEYTDPITGLTYSTNDENFAQDAKENAKSYCRTLLVLPIPGDVDMDGGVTMADAIALQKGLEPANSSAAATKFYGTPLAQDASATLFTRRVCDLTHDGICNDDDVAKLLEGVTPVLDNKGSSDYYYIPLPTGEKSPQYSRKDLVAETAAVGAAQLTLEYLGVEQGSYNEGITSGKVGPQNADKTQGVTLNDTFWMGVKLQDATGVEALAGGVTNFTFTLAYNAKYVAPATVLTAAEKQALQQAGLTKPSEFWKGCLRIYNMSPNSYAIWGNGCENVPAYQFTAATRADLPYATHYSKAITPLEAAVERPEDLKGLVFSIKLENNQVAQALSDGYLLAVPFTLKEHPYGANSAQLIEMSAGMREFVFLHQEKAKKSGFFATLFGGVAEEKTAAYSAQDAIFGGDTSNLKSAVKYTAGAGTAIPLGKDKSPITRLYNQIGNQPTSTKEAKYSELFENTAYQGTALTDIEAVQRALPPGLSVNNRGKITGTPTAARAEPYVFVMNGTKYSILVEQAQLRYYADDQASYYGQPEFRGTTDQNFTFRYYKGDIQQIDLDRNNIADLAALSNLGTALPDVLDDATYAPPIFGARTVGAAELTDKTKCATAEGAHIVPVNLPSSQNYQFVFADKNESGNVANRFTVMKRPIQVAQLATNTVVGTIFSDNTGILRGLKAELSGTKQEFRVEPSTREEDKGYLLSGAGLVAGDSLAITYRADYLRNAGEENTEFVLKPENIQEPRFVKLSELKFQSGNTDYALVSPTPRLQGTEINVTGIVRRRNITALGLTEVPKLTGFTYGDRLERATDLQFTITKDAGSQPESYRYSDEKCISLGIVATWVTADDKKLGEKGMKEQGNAEGHVGIGLDGAAITPYLFNQLLTPYDHNGKYICLSVAAKNDENQPIRVAVYSDKPIEVAQREMTLTAVKQARYYGEENAPLTFTYLPKQLANQDYLAAQKLLGKELTGSGEELEKLLKNSAVGYNAHYTPPTLTAQETLADGSPLVTATTAYSGVDNFITISDARADNYRFRYIEGASIHPNNQEGYSTLRIEKRYVVVTELAAAQKGNLQTLYADTRRSYTDGMTLSPAQGDVTIALPIHTDKTTEFFSLGENVEGVKRNQLGYAPAASAVLEADKRDVEISYRAQFVQDWADPREFPNGYFDMTGATDGSRSCQVEVRGMTLTGSKAKNYDLVYNNPESAFRGSPADCTSITGTDGEQYYVAATGKVMMRPVIGLELLTLPKMDYIYGDLFNPMQPQAGSKLPLQAKVNYETSLDNFPSGNKNAETVNFSIAGRQWDDVNNVWIYTSSFDQRGLVLYRVPEGTTADGVTAEMVLKNGDLLTPAKHHNTKLMLKGNNICTALSEQTLTVAKRTLNLTAEDQFRYYGEENPQDGAFHFDMEELAAPDKKILTDAGMNGYFGAAALRKIQKDAAPPTTRTAANKQSPVVDAGYGGYPVTLSGGTMENYVLKNQGEGMLHVFRRPIVVDTIESDKTRPIYTIYADTPNRTFFTQVSTTKEDKKPYLTQARSNGTGEVYANTQDMAFNQYNQNGKLDDLPLTGAARQGSDELTYRVTVVFDNDLGSISGIGGEQPAKVTKVELSPLNGGENYYLTAPAKPGGAPWTVTGYVSNREMQSIRIVGVPADVAYTYSEELNLTGLKVEVTYNKMGEEQTEPKETFTYRGKESFNANGLFVNYYSQNALPAKTDEKARQAIADGRTADNLDHPTIAPTHDSQVSGEFFTANGKYLVVSGRLRTGNPWVEPKVVKEENVAAVPISVSPLQLTYRLAAADKTYDGDGKTVGTITFTNAYHNKNALDGYNTGDLHDVVYPVIGASYEDKGTNHADYMDFKTLTSTQYAFKTGDYTPEDPAVFNDNGTLTYLGGGYDAPGGKLKFRFTDPNVAYEAPTAHDRYGALKTIPVEATDLHLGGPDAANYTVEQEITAATIQSGAAPGYLSETLPEATILKRNRAPIPTDLLPKIQLDRHTNVIRADYHKALEGLWDTQDAHNQKTDEAVHFEYALDYLQDSTEGRQLKRWAGNDGTLRYQDTIFFGGEALDPGVPKGYLPDPNDIPKELKKEDVVKGQIYRWMEEDKGDTLSGMEGFLVCDASYPGGKPYLGYELFETKRTALPRVGGEVYYPLVRLAETHNYWASPVLSPVTALTPQLLDADERAALALERAELALAADPENQLLKDGVAAAKAEKQKTAAAVMTAITVVEQKAQSAAQTEVQQTLDLAENGRWQEEFVDAAPSEAVQIYRQRMEVTSIAESRGTDPAVKDPFIVPTLEAVWFTNVLDYKDQDVMDAVLRNREPTRYYGYFWDKDKSGMLDFTDRDNPFSLQKPFSVEIEERDADGKTEKKQITVNENHSAHIFAELVPPSSGKERAIHVVPHEVTAKLGDKPLQLTVEFVPTTVRRKSIVWTSADPKVAVVDERNVLTFVGVGTTTITATSRNKKTDTITVTVTGETEEKFPTSVLDLDFTEPYIVLDEALRFRPELKMTRGELVEFLAQFYKENPRWMHRGTGEFTDLTGKESYAEAARLMGSLGIVNGTAQDRFDGDAPATRAEMVTLLARMLDIPPETLAPMTGGFRDSRKEDTWAYGYINALSQRGLLSGVGDGLFAPGRVITRGEAVTLIGRLMNTKIDPGKKNLIVPSDVPQTHWGYYEILRAVNTVDTLEPKNPNEKQS